jgi:hypothetical protein
MSNPGKIGRLPWPLKRELHNQLRDAVPGPVVLLWLNGQEPVQRLLREQWQGRPITPQNLSDYRGSADFKKWLSAQEGLEACQEKSKFVLGLAAEAGMDLMDSADALVVSRLLEDLEMAQGKDAVELMRTLGSFRQGGTARQLLDVRRAELAIAEKRVDLDRDKMEKQTVAKFLLWAKSSEARAILDSGKPKAVQMDLLHDLMFGQRPGSGITEGEGVG